MFLKSYRDELYVKIVKDIWKKWILYEDNKSSFRLDYMHIQKNL